MAPLRFTMCRAATTFQFWTVGKNPQRRYTNTSILFVPRGAFIRVMLFKWIFGCYWECNTIVFNMCIVLLPPLPTLPTNLFGLVVLRLLLWHHLLQETSFPSFVFWCLPSYTDCCWVDLLELLCDVLESKGGGFVSYSCCVIKYLACKSSTGRVEKERTRWWVSHMENIGR